MLRKKFSFSLLWGCLAAFLIHCTLLEIVAASDSGTETSRGRKIDTEVSVHENIRLEEASLAVANSYKKYINALEKGSAPEVLRSYLEDYEEKVRACSSLRRSMEVTSSITVSPRPASNSYSSYSTEACSKTEDMEQELFQRRLALIDAHIEANNLKEASHLLSELLIDGRASSVRAAALERMNSIISRTLTGNQSPRGAGKQKRRKKEPPIKGIYRNSGFLCWNPGTTIQKLIEKTRKNLLLETAFERARDFAKETISWCKEACIQFSLLERKHPSSMPDEWIDEETGHRVIRLSRRAGNNHSFYFHQNSFTSNGDRMVFIGYEEGGGANLYAVNLQEGNRKFEVTKLTWRGFSHEIVAAKSREVFYSLGDRVYATHLDTLATREIARIPSVWNAGRGFSINCDETLLAGTYAEGEEEYYEKYPREVWIEKLFKARLKNILYTVEIATGKVSIIYETTDWIGHPQFSPADPQLLLFCHEGPDFCAVRQRMWLIRIGDSNPVPLHLQVENEEVTHEFWAPSGACVWSDIRNYHYIRTPGKPGLLSDIFLPDTYIACTDIATSRTTKYRITPSQWCWHYNVSPDGKNLAGDGSGRLLIGHRPGKWIYLFTPSGTKMKVERLCSMKNCSYRFRPNVHFSPDNRMVVFQADFSGTEQVYGVEINPSVP